MSAVTSKKIKVTLNKKYIGIKGFKDYINLYMKSLGKD